MFPSDFNFSLITNFLFPVYHILKRDNLWPIIKDLEQFQWYDKEVIKTLQQQKLLKLLKHCYKNSPYYQDVFKGLGLSGIDLADYENFRKIPFLTKKLINENRTKIIARGYAEKDLIKNSTSGSTGESLYFYQDKKSSLYRQAALYRSQNWTGCKYADKKVQLWGAVVDIRKGNSLRRKIHRLFNQTALLSSYDLSDASMEAYAKFILSYQPKLFISYPSPLATFAEFVLQRNIKFPSIKSIITSSETLYEWQRDLVVKAFNCKIYDRYGSREFGCIAHQCDVGEGYHINMDRVFLEILDENGGVVPPGETGEIYLTDLDNYAFPFIRYKIGDMASFTDEKCICGRGLSMLNNLEGRSFDIIKAPNGNRIAGTFWSINFRRFAEVKNFQVEQIEIDKLIVKIVLANGFPEQIKDGLTSLIKNKCGDGMQIEYRIVEDIALTKSGKKKFVISHLNEH